MHRHGIVLSSRIEVLLVVRIKCDSGKRGAIVRGQQKVFCLDSDGAAESLSHECRNLHQH